MQLINTATQEITGYSAFKALYPNVSFPRDPANIPFEDYGFAVVQPTEPPAVAETQRVVEGSPELVDGQWRQTWTVQDREQRQRTTISKLEFVSRFTDAEKAYLMGTPAYAPLVLHVLAADMVDVADETAQAAQAALAQAVGGGGGRVFSDERIAAIFAPVQVWS